MPVKPLDISDIKSKFKNTKMLTINSPSTYIPERKYIIGLLFGEFLGLEHRIRFNHEPDVSVKDADGKKLVLADNFFQTSQDDWLTSVSLPQKPLPIWDSRQIVSGIPLLDPIVPVIFGNLVLYQRKV